MSTFTTKMTKSQAEHLAALIAKTGQYASRSENGRLFPIKTSATCIRITCHYDKESETMEIYSDYTRDNVVNEFDYLKKFPWTKAGDPNLERTTSVPPTCD